MSAGSVAVSLAPLAVVAVWLVQSFVTSPGVITDREWHAMLLTAIPALTVVLSAHWVDAGRRKDDQ
jgi:hypothetical protein